MKIVKFLKKETIAFDGINPTHFEIGDKVEAEKINKVSNTLLEFYKKTGVVEVEGEEKSLNPVIENKAITNFSNKVKEFSFQDLKKKLKELKISFTTSDKQLVLLEKLNEYNKQMEENITPEETTEEVNPQEEVETETSPEEINE